jgi:hypothetical protein
MSDRSFLSWPFFEPRHRELAEKLQEWCAASLRGHGADLGFAPLLQSLGQLPVPPLEERPGEEAPVSQGESSQSSEVYARAHSHARKPQSANGDVGCLGLLASTLQLAQFVGRRTVGQLP